MSSDCGNPKVILLLSGKRKCGKDFIAEKLKSILKNDCSILRISGPIKKHYSETCGVSFEDLLSDGPFKEKYRLDMIVWGESIRAEDPGCFCRIACEEATKTPVWIVSDIRRKSDVEFFKKIYGDKTRTVRISASENVRKSRGWIFTQGVDDAESECNLDDFHNWDLKITNEEGEKENLQKILNLINVRRENEK